MLLSVVAIGYQAPEDDITTANAVTSKANEVIEAPIADVVIDEKSATDIAASLAFQTNMPVAANVASLSISLEANKEVIQDSGAIAKPQIVDSAEVSRDVIRYVSREGENAQIIADKFGVTKDTVLWANNLSADEIDAGTELKILPVTGVLYSIADNDTVESIAGKYGADAARIISYNDLEVGGLSAGKQIIIPGGILPEEDRPGYEAPTRQAASQPYNRLSPGNGAQAPASSNVTASVGNKYAFGNCTFYVYERRPDIGSFWGNASGWAASARAAGFTVVQGAPKAGAIFQYGGGYGHVGIVESVDPANGTMRISDMNGIAGFNAVGYDTVPINSSWNYIY